MLYFKQVQAKISLSMYLFVTQMIRAQYLLFNLKSVKVLNYCLLFESHNYIPKVYLEHVKKSVKVLHCLEFVAHVMLFPKSISNISRNQ